MINRDALLQSDTLAVIGLGYVGLPFCLLIADCGFKVVGIDIDADKVRAINDGRSYIAHISSSQIAKARQREVFTATTDFAAVNRARAIIICVPTPLDDKMQPDLKAVRVTAESIAPHLQPGQLVVLESSTYPGTTEELLVPILERSGLRASRGMKVAAAASGASASGGSVATVEEDRRFFAAFSPEREDPGNQQFTTRQIPKIIGGIDEESLGVASELYSRIFERIVPVHSCRVAEMAKLLENIYRCVNIALVNELKVLCHRMGMDPFEVIEAAATKPFGFQPFFPGPGLGGHCIPVDPFYLTWKAKEYDCRTRFIELAGDINAEMPYYVRERIVEGLNGQMKSLRGSKILVLGIAYKRDIDDVRESPSLKLIDLLLKAGAQVEYNDPYCPHIGSGRHYDLEMDSVALDEPSLGKYDCLVIVTDHSCYDYAKIVKFSGLVVDTRNATHGLSGNILQA